MQPPTLLLALPPTLSPPDGLFSPDFSPFNPEMPLSPHHAITLCCRNSMVLFTLLSIRPSIVHHTIWKFIRAFFATACKRLIHSFRVYVLWTSYLGNVTVECLLTIWFSPCRHWSWRLTSLRVISWAMLLFTDNAPMKFISNPYKG